MKRKNKNRKERRRITTLRSLLVIAFVALLGTTVWWGRVHWWGNPHVLFAPDVLVGARSSSEIGPPARRDRAWVLDHVDLLRADTVERLSSTVYAQLYHRLARTKPSREPSEKLEVAFAHPEVIRLRLVLSPCGKSAAAVSPCECQEIQIAPGGMVRVQSPYKDKETIDPWVYFRVSGIERLLNTKENRKQLAGRRG